MDGSGLRVHDARDRAQRPGGIIAQRRLVALRETHLGGRVWVGTLVERASAVGRRSARRGRSGPPAPKAARRAASVCGGRARVLRRWRGTRAGGWVVRRRPSGDDVHVHSGCGPEAAGSLGDAARDQAAGPDPVVRLLRPESAESKRPSGAQTGDPRSVPRLRHHAAAAHLGATPHTASRATLIAAVSSARENPAAVYALSWG